MIIKQFRTGGDRNLGYLAADEVSGDALVVDASYNPGMIYNFACEHGLTIRYLFSTHGHSDHTNGNATTSQLTGLKPLLYGDTCPETGISVRAGARFPLGSGSVLIIHTPGHTEDSICLHVGDALFTGDTLFTGKVGGTMTAEQALAEYDSLRNKLMRLPDETRVFPGHDYGSSPASTIAEEKKSNPFLLQPDFRSFLALKQNWAAYKKEHGIA
ncbi:hydroxyacylglutathione hydrolase family protein [Chlorobium phaeobacteroides]|uniref:Beta-lactamase domain protein n=1 Tax=Chlorobium phaeobacteroides (strain DSM 266 / SMG 266 / 2430) TaxID=290317 RepID=A1BCW9_CHLPD|nr:hydroxyacylglutathione hydrolase family protein [Chlorobium phaeobacteroides]ABL64246.1 beta-lactamase domain protein [Chlorobium phaeobacteroides DSM 266]